MSAAVQQLPPGTESLRAWCDGGVLSAADVHVAGWVCRAAAADHGAALGPDGLHPLVVHAVAMAAWASRNGHSCADLTRLPAVVEHQRRVRAADEQAIELPALEWPEADAVLAALTARPEIVRVVDGPDAEPVLDRRPVVVCGARVYLQRHWVDECVIAASVRSLAASPARSGVLHPAATALLDELLPATVDGAANAQRAAAEVALRQRLAVVVGGPGTGKTYTVARLLAVLLEQARRDGRDLHIGLAAPTGKAAQRLRESILGALAGDAPIPDDVRASLHDLEPRTIHKLLGYRPGRQQRFAHDDRHPLPHDVVVIDETSMVSSPLFARLLEAVGGDTRLVLLGDPDQLESVDRGAVLADLVDAAGAGGPLAEHVVRLRRGHRFEDDSQIARLADAVRDGDGPGAVAVVRGAPALDEHGHGLRVVDAADPLDPSAVAAVAAVLTPVLHEARMAAEAGDAAAALAATARARVLCAHREGPHGVSAWNRLGEQWMCGPAGASQVWYPGRPLLVTANDPRLGLANGDTGVVVRHDGRLLVAFPGPVGLLDPVQLESVDTAFAMTVHKSQGSEYPVVVMVLPPPSSPLVGRELLYTGVTRAKAALYVVGTDAALSACVATPAMRMTGLAAGLSDQA
ncbi:MAG: exodeoxyribonuclease V subunit alpha [Ilumatobacteraceae bacterium]